MGGGEGRVGVGGWGGRRLNPRRVLYRGDMTSQGVPMYPQLHSHAKEASFRSQEQSQGDGAQMVRSIGAKISAMALQARKTILLKSRPL